MPRFECRRRALSVLMCTRHARGVAAARHVLARHERHHRVIIIGACTVLGSFECQLGRGERSGARAYSVGVALAGNVACRHAAVRKILIYNRHK